MSKPWLLKLIALLLIVVPELGLAKAPATPLAEEHAQSLLSAFVSYTDLRMRSIQQSLEILASTTEARSARWKKMQPLLGGYEKSDGGLIIWFLKPDGTYYTVDQGLMDLKLTDRSYFPTLMSGQKVVGELVISKSTGQRSAVIAVPISDGGKVVGAIGASLFLDGLSNQVAAALALSADAAYFALAPDGRTGVHKKTERHLVDPREMGSASLAKAVNEMLAKPGGITSYEFDGVRKRAVYRTSPLTQWKFAITFE